MRDHDINFYLSQRPPAFFTAVSIAAVIAAVLGIILVRTIARWALALPLVLFEGVSPRRALAESTTRSAGHRATSASSRSSRPPAWRTTPSSCRSITTWSAG